MEDQRKLSRYDRSRIKKSFLEADVFVRGIHINAIIENLSRIGACLALKRLDFIKEGDSLIIEFSGSDITIKCICVHCDTDDNVMSLGVLFTGPLDEALFVDQE
jgi:hypothetical protein